MDEWLVLALLVFRWGLGVSCFLFYVALVGFQLYLVWTDDLGRMPSPLPPLIGSVPGLLGLIACPINKPLWAWLLLIAVEVSASWSAGTRDAKRHERFRIEQNDKSRNGSGDP